MSGMVINKVSNDAAVSNKHIEPNYQKNQAQEISKTAKDTINQNKTHDQKEVSPKDLKKIINKINENVSMLNQNVKFAYNDTIKSLTVEVVDVSTGKVIREIPPKEVINLQKKLSEVVGIIFDSKEVK